MKKIFSGAPLLLLLLVFSCFIGVIGCSSGGGGGGSDTYAISGTITGASSVTVTLSGAKSATTTTSTTGAYSFTGLSNGSYTLTPSKSGYTFSPATRSVTVSSANVTGQNFTASSTSGYSISGTITGASSVTVTLSGAKSATTTTSTTGAYSFTGLSNGSYTLTPSKSGYTFSPTTRSVAVSSANVTAQNFTASSTATYSISGTVTGATSVTLTLSGSSSATTTTNSSGVYSFTGLSNGSYVVTPSKTGYTFSPTTRSATISSANVTGQNFTASSLKYTISGTISWSGFTQSSGVFVAILSTDPTFQDMSQFVTYEAVISTGAQSGSRSYSFSNLSAGNYYVAGFVGSASPFVGGMHNGDKVGLYSSGVWIEYGGIPQTIEATGSTTSITGKNFSLLSTYSVSGSINGSVKWGLNGLSGVSVVLSGSTSSIITTDATGAISFSGLSVGTYVLTPTKEACLFTPTSKLATIESSGEVNIGDFRAEKYSSIAGIVSVEGGTPVSGVTLVITPEGWNIPAPQTVIATTGADGLFSFSGLVVSSYEGNWFMSASKPGYTFNYPIYPGGSSGSWYINGNSSGVIIPAIQGTFYTLSGTVSSPDATGINGAYIRVVGDNGFTGADRTDSSGHYSISLPNSRYHLYVSAESFLMTTSEEVFYVTGDTTKNYQALIYYGPFYNIYGTVTDEVGAVVEGATVFADGIIGITVETNSSGQYSVPLCAGNFTMRINKDGYPETSRLIAVSTTAEVNFKISRLYSISGTINNLLDENRNSVYVMANGSSWFPLEVDASGNYIIPTVEAGTYAIEVTTERISSFPQRITPTEVLVTIETSSITDLDFSASTLVNVSGRITNEVGASVQGVLVRANNSSDTSRFASCETDSNGDYLLKLMAGDIYVVFPTSESFEFTPDYYVYSPLSVTHEGEDFLAYSSYTLSGTLYNNSDGDPTPVPFGTISGCGNIATADAGGNYSLQVRAGTWDFVLFSADGFTYRTTEAVTISGNTNRDFNLRRVLMTVSGYVRDSQSAGNLSGAVISPTGVGFLPTQTDGSGFYSLQVYTGTWEFSVTKEGYVATAETKTISGSEEFTFYLDRTRYTFSGTITDECGGAGVEGVTVWGGGYIATTDATGFFSMEVPWNSYDFFTEKEGYYDRQKNVYIGENTGWNTTLNRLVLTLSGTIEDQFNRKISGAIVSYPYGATTTNAQGEYSLSVKYGNWTFSITKEGFANTEAGIDIVSDFEWSPLFNRNDYLLTGTITDETTGDPVSGATVSCTTLGGVPATTAANGTYSLLIYYGDWYFSVSKTGFSVKEEQLSITGNTSWSPPLTPNP